MCNALEEFSLSQEEASGYVKKYQQILKRMAPVNYALVKKDFGLSDRSLLLCSWRRTKEISPPKGELTQSAYLQAVAELRFQDSLFL